MQLHAEQVQRVVHADAHAEGDHRQGRHLHADAHGHHQRLAEHRGQHQRQDRHQGRPPAAEGDQAEQTDGGIDEEQHGPIGRVHHAVGSRFDTGGASGEEELAVRLAVLGGEALGDGGDFRQRLGLVILEEGDHRHQRAVGVEQLRGVHRGLLGGVVEHVLVALQAEELRVALVGAGGDLPYRVGQRHGGLHARMLLQGPGQAIGEDQGLVVQAAFRRGLHHHRELVAGQRVMAGDVGVVDVVARVGAQFRSAGVEIADLQLEADHVSAHAHGDSHQHGRQRPFPLGETVEEIPDAAEALVRVGAGVDAQGAFGGRFRDTGVGQRHRHHQQGGEDQHADTDAGGDRQVLDDRDVDQHQHGEADHVRQQRGNPGEEQAAEGVARGHQLVGATADVLHDAVHLLRGMGYADGEHQERYEDGVRVQRVTEPGDDAELPDHRQQRTADHQQAAAQATGVGEDDEEGGHQRHGEERHHPDQAVDQVADQLGEADHADFHRALPFLTGSLGVVVAGVFEAQAQLVFQLAGELVVVDTLAVRRIAVEQRHHQHGGLEVVGDQAADDAGTGDVLPQRLDARLRAVVAVRHHRAALEAFLGHFGPAHAGRPQRLHPGAIDAGAEEQLVMHLLECVEVGRVEDVALRILHHHPYVVAQAAQRIAVGQEVLDVRMALGNHLLEARLQLQPGHGHVAEQHGHQQDAEHERQTVVEHDPFEQVAAACVEILEIPDYRHYAFFHRTHEGSPLYLFLFRSDKRPLSQATVADQHQTRVAMRQGSGYRGQGAGIQRLEGRATIRADQHVAGLAEQVQAAIGATRRRRDAHRQADRDLRPVRAAVGAAEDIAAQAVGQHHAGFGVETEEAALVGRLQRFEALAGRVQAQQQALLAGQEQVLAIGG
ncbi:hypothetical protein D3C78_628150 [compost metagenome]